MSANSRGVAVPVRSRKVLVVDDEAQNRKLLRLQLESSGHAVVEAADGLEALQRLAHEPVDAIISDIFMPNLDGYRLCEALASDPRYAAVPVILYSATFTAPGDERLALDAGAVQFLRKPARAGEICAAVEWAAAAADTPRVASPASPRLHADRMIAKLEEKSAELAQFRAAIDEAGDGIFIVEPERGVILDCNTMAAVLVGSSRERVLGRRLAEFDADLLQRVPWSMLLEEAGRQGHLIAETLCRREDGSTLPVEVKARYVKAAPHDYIVGVMRDITERKRAEQAVLESESRFRQMAENIDEVFWLTDAEKNSMLYVSPAYERIWGRACEHLRADPRGWLEAIHPADRERVAEAALTRQAAGMYDEEYRIVRSDGTVRWIRDRAFPVRDAQGRVQRVAGVAADITERRAAAEQLAALNAGLEQRVAQRTAQLEAANKDLETFSYTVSHDLRAPLRAIDNFSNFLLEDHAVQLDVEGRRLLDVIRKNTARMSQLIDDVLDFARASRADVAGGVVDMAALAQDVFAQLQQAQPAPVTFSADAVPAAWGDGAMLRQVLANLLGNAVKFTRGREAAAITFTAHDEGGETVYAVRDNGAGFDGKYAHKLFGTFQRLHTADQFEGTGVGLAIVKRIVNRHGGRVWAECNSDGPGATFRFALPRAAAAVPPSHGESSEQR